MTRFGTILLGLSNQRSKESRQNAALVQNALATGKANITVIVIVVR
jgi:hypothetical protein